MSHSVFNIKPILSPSDDIVNNDEFSLDNTESELCNKKESNVVVVYDKNGMHVDKSELKNLMDENNISTLSVVRFSSSKDLKTDDKKNKSSNTKTNDIKKVNNEDLLSILEPSPEKNENTHQPELINLMIEQFYNAEETKKLAKEILNCAGVTNPLELEIDLEFQRMVIQNDHCYTLLTSPNQNSERKSPNTTINSSKFTISNTATENYRPGSKVNTNKMQSNKQQQVGKQQQKITVEKQQTSVPNDKDSGGEEEEDHSEYTESSFSESDNDRDSDLDFNVNDRLGKRRKNRKRGKIGKKLNKKKQLSMERELILDEERRNSFKGNKSNLDLKKTPGSSNAFFNAKNINKYSGNKQKGIQIISQNVTSEVGNPQVGKIQQQTKLKNNVEIIKTEILKSSKINSVLKKEKKSEGVFTDISTFLKEGESNSKPNLKVTQLKTDSKGFMPLGIEIGLKNELPGQISIQTHQSTSELAAENDKQLDLIDSIVKDEMKKVSVIEKNTMNENIPRLVKMLESTEKVVLNNSNMSKLSIGNSSTFAHSVEDIDISNATLLQNEEDEIPEDLLQHVVDLIDNKTIQEVIEKEILPSTSTDRTVQDDLEIDTSLLSEFSENMNDKSLKKQDSVEVIRKDGRVIKLPPIEAPTTRAKRRAQSLRSNAVTSVKEVSSSLKSVVANVAKTHGSSSRRYSVIEQKTTVTNKKRASISSRSQSIVKEKDESAEEESDSEDDPNKLWCICRQPHNNRFMICCDECEDWFHGTCVNITKAMGLEIEIKNIEWSCPNCLKKENSNTKKSTQKKINNMFSKKTDLKKLESEAKQPEQEKQVTENKKMPQAQSSAANTNMSNKFEQFKNIELKAQKSNVSENIQKKLITNESNFIQKKLTDVIKTVSLPEKSEKKVSKIDVNQVKGIEQNKVGEPSRKLSSNLNIKVSPSTFDKSGNTKNVIINKTQKIPTIQQQQRECDNSEVFEIKLKNKVEKHTKLDVDQLLTCIVCKKLARPNSIYCSDDCISKHVQSALVTASKIVKETTSPADKKKNINSFEEALAKASETSLQPKYKIERVYVFERKSGRVLTGSNAPTTANLKKWLQDNPTFEIIQPGSSQAIAIERNRVKQKQLNEQVKPNSSTSSSSTTVTSTKPTILTSSFSAKNKINLHAENQVTTYSPKVVKKPSMIVIKYADPRVKIEKQETLESRDNVKDVKDEKDVKSSKITKRQISVDQTKSPLNPVTNDAEPIRLMVKKTLKEQLLTRITELKNINAPKLSENEIEEFVNETENEMYKLFNSDVGAKYKAKYRSLMFNIKDRKNETLFQKICGKIIEPKQLVRMSPEEMASQELAQWRQNENKHQLEMIKKSELDLLSCKKTYVLKTHKGEDVIESKSTNQVSLDITIPVEDVVTVLNNSAVSSTSDEAVLEISRGKDNISSSNDLSYDLNSDLNITQENENKEKLILTTATSTTSDKKKHSSRDKSHDRHHRSKDKHKHRKRSRSHSRGHRSSSHEEKRSKTEKTQKKSFDNVIKKEKFEFKDKTNSKDKHSNKDKIRGDMESKSNAKVSLQLKDGKKDELKLLNKSSNKSETISKSEDYNLIDKILESTKTVEEAANLVGESQEKEKEKMKQSDKQKYSISKSKSSEINSNPVDSDQEPSSTVTIATPPEDPYAKYSNDIGSIIWSGSINMIDVATFQIIIQPVSGIVSDLEKDLPVELDVVGRIGPDTVWEYIGKIKKSPNKEIVIVCLAPSCETEISAYVSLYEYLDKRKRLGVIKTTSPHLKDFYIVPLKSGKLLPLVLQTTNKNHEFFEDDSRPDLLMGIVIRIMGKRTQSQPLPLPPPSKIRKTADVTVTPNHISSVDEDRFTPPNSPKRKFESKNLLPSKLLLTDSGIDLDSIIPASKLSKSYDPDDEPYSPGGSSDDENIAVTLSNRSSADNSRSENLKRKMEELNRQIEAQQMEIAGMLNMDPNTNFSGVNLTPALANISIPSNLQQILASIKQTPSVSSTLTSSSTPVVATVKEPKIQTQASSSHSSTSYNLCSDPSSLSFSPKYFLESSVAKTTPQFDTGSVYNVSNVNSEEYIPIPSTSKTDLKALTDIIKDQTNTTQSVEDNKVINSIDKEEKQSFAKDVDLRLGFSIPIKSTRWDKMNQD